MGPIPKGATVVYKPEDGSEDNRLFTIIGWFDGLAWIKDIGEKVFILGVKRNELVQVSIVS